MAANVTNFIQGPGDLFIGLFGATEPLDSAINTAYAGTAFSDIGGTLGGVAISVDQTWSELEADQIPEDAGARMVRRRMQVTTKLAEPTLANLAYVLNDTAPTTATGSTAFEPSDGVAQFIPTYRALLFQGHAPNGKRRWLIVRKVLSVEGTGFTAKKDDQGAWDVTWRSFYVSSAIRPFRVVDGT